MNAETCGKHFYHKAMLVACIVQNNGNRLIVILLFELFEKSDKAIGAEVGSIDKNSHFFGDGIYGTQ